MLVYVSGFCVKKLKSLIKLAFTLKEFLNSGCPSCRKVLNAQKSEKTISGERI